MVQRGGWVIDVDIPFVKNIVDHGQLLDVLDERVGDGVNRHVLGNRMNAGMLENGVIESPEDGVPHGGCISPLQTNLHDMLDKRFHGELQPRLWRQSFLIRFADDCVLGLEREEDALRVLALLTKRLERFGLTMHLEKTRLFDFRRPDRR